MKRIKEEKSEIVFFLTIIAVLVAIVSLSLIFIKFSSLFSLSGLATGTVNISIESAISINFTTNHINWSFGQVTAGQTSATLLTDGPSVTNGNWSTTGVSGLILENIGNVNASLKIAAAKTAATLLGGTNPSYQWNFSINEGGDSCVNHTNTNLSLTYYDANASIGVCDIFQYLDANDTIRIDFKLVVPYDSLTGAQSDTITATGTAA